MCLSHVQSARACRRAREFEDEKADGVRWRVEGLAITIRLSSQRRHACTRPGLDGEGPPVDVDRVRLHSSAVCASDRERVERARQPRAKADALALLMLMATTDTPPCPDSAQCAYRRRPVLLIVGFCTLSTLVPIS